jgi:uncharacterized protein YceH (UPF0502 family)
MSRTRKLDAIEIRVLGALMEKEQTTPDHYPLTTNAVIAASNQKSNRDPVMELTETQVTEALDRLRDDVLTWRVDSSRAERWQHSLDRRWELDKRKKAVMTLLLLRGPQTPGELRTRSERLHHFESVDEVEETLVLLANGFDAMVCELQRQPGQREARWMHLESADSDPLDDTQEIATVGEPGPASVSAAALSIRRESVRTEVSAVEAERRRADDERLEELEAQVKKLQEQMLELREDLGMDA